MNFDFYPRRSRRICARRRAPTSGRYFSVAYDDTGNIASKSDVGAYVYASGGQPLPHAVRSIAGTVNGIVNPNYRYDANGNLICVYTGASCVGSGIVRESDTYWSFNMAKVVTEGTTSVAFVYDSEHSRITQTVTNGSTSTVTTYLNDVIAGATSEKAVSGGITTWTDYLKADDRLVGQRSCIGSTLPCNGATKWQFFVTDHLGSVAVVTDGTTGSTTYGQVTQRMAFDPWGRQRNLDGTDDPTCSLGQSNPTTRGFTGHEEIASLCLVNMNARLYDPTIARFMAPDSIIPDPNDGQSYNRYTYVDNRPLSLTDPTGHYGDPNLDPCGGGGVGCKPPETVPVYGRRQDDSAMLNPPLPGPFALQKQWVQALETRGARNINVSQNSNGSLAIKFSCSSGNAGCMQAGEELNDTYGGSWTFAGGEETEASDYTADDTSSGLSDRYAANSGGGPYTTDAPAGLRALRADQTTGLTTAEDHLRSLSQPKTIWERLFGSPEAALFGFKVTRDGKVFYTYKFIRGDSGHHLTMAAVLSAIQIPNGYSSVFIMEHTHPSPWGFGVYFGQNRGPSLSFDMPWTTQPQLVGWGTYFVIQDVNPQNEWGYIYYGKTAGF